ncbi:hypothetical protein AC249_AIPGENE21504 [Exaiptasia diaphana]|nr:hypothetical protein AC249_AIPGENE21504 [Exaiptasia diaphana]
MDIRQAVKLIESEGRTGWKEIIEELPGVLRASRYLAHIQYDAKEPACFYPERMCAVNALVLGKPVKGHEFSKLRRYTTWEGKLKEYPAPYLINALRMLLPDMKLAHYPKYEDWCTWVMNWRGPWGSFHKIYKWIGRLAPEAFLAWARTPKDIDPFWIRQPYHPNPRWLEVDREAETESSTSDSDSDSDFAFDWREQSPCFFDAYTDAEEWFLNHYGACSKDCSRCKEMAEKMDADLERLELHNCDDQCCHSVDDGKGISA